MDYPGRSDVIRTLSLILSLFVPYSATAELTGADRAAFIKNFIQGCERSEGTSKLIAALGGASSQQQGYCDCVANAYADRLNIETVSKGREIEILSIADWSRKLCLTSLFPGKGPFGLDFKDRRFYPKDADTVKRMLDWTKNAQSTLSVDIEGIDRVAQIIVIDASAELFCWSEPLSVESRILGSSSKKPVISPIWCEESTGGYGEVFQIAAGKFVVGFALESGLKEWSVHEVELDRR